MQHPSRSYLSTSAQFPMPSTIENNSSFSQCERGDTVCFDNDNGAIPMSPYFGNGIHQPEMVSLPGISNENTGTTRSIQHHSNPTYVTGISSIEGMHVTSSITGLMKNAEDETDAQPSEPPPSYNELFGRKPKTVDASTSMDTTTITITRTITVPNNRINPNRHERPVVNYPAYDYHIPNDKTITCTCVTIRVFVIGTLFFAVYYMTTFITSVIW